jgi:hypothetical protein
MELQDFKGRWRLQREIVHADAPDARFEGEAVWSEAGDSLAYRETGRLTVTGHPPMETERRYLWRAGLRVYFDDGRFFHQVPPEGGEARHWCDPDDYHVVYRFEDWPEFETVWTVKGPRKEYRMISRYSPQAK